MKPGRFRKKPVVIEAMPWRGEASAQTGTGVDPVDLVAWGAKVQKVANPYGEADADRGWMLQVWVEPEQSWVNVPVGHWIIKGVKGEFYPCDPEIFEQIYEAAE